MLIEFFWVFPVISASTWLTTLSGMLGHWYMMGEPTFGRMQPGQTIPFISDIGAQQLKPLFMIGSFITMFFMNVTFYQFVHYKEHVNSLFVYASFLFAMLGSVGLITLSVFDNLDHLLLHDTSVTIFLTGYLVSAVVICMDYFYLRASNRVNKRMLMTSFMIKITFVIVELAFIVAFRILAAGGNLQSDTAAVLEWIIAFTFTGYILSFIIDLLPSSQKFPDSHQYQQLEMGMDTNSSRLMI
ncbi:hypothetical protein N7478_005200 [Penicillium angulare]|uniref:uncharacterized protein n=1 Tax=Penicillium angulare TaxID=116970 RepID=UPI002540CC33|nr:uncharacterized protein N7478_005200 [Penicillium angulare]KAJ5279828.1 hypothetical protein N7478_005200 [Penicillium angulare]